MAYIEDREHKDGTWSYVVRWRAGGARAGKRASGADTSPRPRLPSEETPVPLRTGVTDEAIPVVLEGLAHVTG